jgi:hypothetical protein
VDRVRNGGVAVVDRRRQELLEEQGVAGGGGDDRVAPLGQHRRRGGKVVEQVALWGAKTLFTASNTRDLQVEPSAAVSKAMTPKNSEVDRPDDVHTGPWVAHLSRVPNHPICRKIE